MLRLLLTGFLILANAGGLSDLCNPECDLGAQCYSGYDKFDDCMCVCKDAENRNCVEGATERVKFEKDGKTYEKSVIKFIGKTKKVQKIKEEDEPSYDLNCPQGWAPKEGTDKALGMKHGWPAAKAANHPSLTCFLPCPANYGDLPGVTFAPVNPQCDCEVTLDYEDTACDLANSEDPVLKKNCKWSGRITNTNNGWKIHYIPGEYQEETKAPPCRDGWEQADSDSTDGHIVCLKKTTCKKVLPEIPCGSKDQELIQAELAVLEAAMDIALPQYKELGKDDAPCKKEALKSMPIDVAGGSFLSESEESSPSEGKRKQVKGRGKLIELAALAQASSQEPHKYGPIELILNCIGVASKASEAFLEARPGKCEPDGVLRNLCFNPGYDCMKGLPTDEKSYSNSGLNAGGMYMSSDISTALYPPRLKYKHLKPISAELVNTGKSADAKLPGRPQLSCQAIAKSVYEHMKSGSGDRDMKGCIERAFTTHKMTFPKHWIANAYETIENRREEGGNYFSRAHTTFRLKSRKKCRTADKAEAAADRKETKKVGKRLNLQDELKERQAELDKVCDEKEVLKLKPRFWKYTKRGKGGHKAGERRGDIIVTYLRKSGPRDSQQDCEAPARKGLCKWHPGNPGKCGPISD